MNKRQKEVQQAHLDEEKKIIRQLKQVYRQAAKDCEAKIVELNSRADMQNLQSIIYQKQYQQALKKQLDGILDTLQSNEFDSIAKYLTQSYENGFYGTLYDLHGQGIPVIFPIDQTQVVKAIQTDTKLSEGMYSRLGEDTAYLKKSIRAELSRGISNGSSWLEIASHIANGMNSPFKKAINNAIRIARTEGHRIQNQAQMDTITTAKEKGADVVKQWDSTLDDRTRDSHKILDGQIREIEDYFEVNGHRALHPGAFGVASEDIHCRCCMLQRAKWALDADELKTLEQRAAYFGLDKSKDLEEFKKKFKVAVEQENKNGYDILGNTTKLKGTMKDSDYDEYMKILNGHQNESIRKLYAGYADGVSGIKLSASDGYYSPAGNNIVFSYVSQQYMDNGRGKYETLAHEYGHYFDAKAEFDGISFKELETIANNTTYGQHLFKKCASSSDEFLSAVRKDRALLKTKLTKEVEQDLKQHDASSGVQDAIDGLLSHRIKWGHGDRYYNRKYSSVKSLSDQTGLKKAYQELGLDASNQAKVQRECRVYESASEMWANIMAAEVNGGDSLEYVKEYLPNSYQAMIDILERTK